MSIFQPRRYTMIESTIRGSYHSRSGCVKDRQADRSCTQFCSPMSVHTDNVVPTTFDRALTAICSGRTGNTPKRHTGLPLSFDTSRRFGLDTHTFAERYSNGRTRIIIRGDTETLMTERRRRLQAARELRKQENIKPRQRLIPWPDAQTTPHPERQIVSL